MSKWSDEFIDSYKDTYTLRRLTEELRNLKKKGKPVIYGQK